jgi:Flagellar hook-length control protein FliK
MRVPPKDDQTSSNSVLRPKPKRAEGAFGAAMQLSDIQHQKDRLLTDMRAVTSRSSKPNAGTSEHKPCAVSSAQPGAEDDPCGLGSGHPEEELLPFESLFAQIERKYCGEMFPACDAETAVGVDVPLQDVAGDKFPAVNDGVSEQVIPTTIVDFMAARERKLARVHEFSKDFAPAKSEINALEHHPNLPSQKNAVDGRQHETVMFDNSIATQSQTFDSALQQMQRESLPLPSTLNPAEQISRAVADQLVERPGVLESASPALLQAAATTRALRLNLHPAELGLVDVTISKRGRRLDVVIVPELESTGKLLMGDASQLLQRLGLATADAGHVQVRIETPTRIVDLGSNTMTSESFADSRNQSTSGDGGDGQSKGMRLNPYEGIHADVDVENGYDISSGVQRRSDALYV